MGTTEKTAKPIAVVISDVHYSKNTLELADAAFRHAIDTAHNLGLPLIDCGDLTNDKAILRGEVVNALVETMRYAQSLGVKVYNLVGNHSLLNEKHPEHTLHFLDPYVRFVIDEPMKLDGFYFIPYQQSAEAFVEALHSFPKGSIVFGHQGTREGLLGDYVKDDRAFDHKLAKDYRVFLGHYHAHYELGTTVSIGNPYTLTFGEAKDPSKGYLVVYSDGSYERIILTLRKHIKLDLDAEGLDILCSTGSSFKKDDLLWVKVTGPASELSRFHKADIGNRLIGHSNFKFDKIVLKSEETIPQNEVQKLDDSQLMDGLIDTLKDPDSHKSKLKALWRDVTNETPKMRG